MVGEMLRLGHHVPDIDEIEGPFVRVSLVGDAVDEAWIQWLESINPSGLVDDLNMLLLLRHLVDKGWVDTRTAEPLLQLNQAETQGAITHAMQAMIRGANVIALVPGTPDDEPPAWTLAGTARSALQEHDSALHTFRPWPSRQGIARSYARARGRISTTELGGLVGASPTNVDGVLKELENAGDLRPSRSNRRGPGFYYLPNP